MNKNDQLSFLARNAKLMVKGELSKKYVSTRYYALFLLIIGAIVLWNELPHGESAYQPAVVMATVFIFVALSLFQKSGFMELIEKEYKQNSNQNMDPIVTTPVD